MFVKLITCYCHLTTIKEVDENFHYNATFGCCNDKEVKHFASVCKSCPYNSYMFQRNYFASINCGCEKIDKRSYCGFCDTLKDHLNYRVLKVCINIADLIFFPFKIVPLKKYLWDVKVDPFFVFDAVLEYIDVSNDHPSFFIVKKLTKNELFCLELL